MTPHEATQAALRGVASIPRAENEATFAEPWQAEAFALVLSLHAKGLFEWTEWADRLAVEIAAAQATGDPGHGDTYYHHWLMALEKLVVEKGLLDAPSLATRHEAWDRAARATPHGEPIVLGRENLFR